jgi:hypothetical protein
MFLQVQTLLQVKSMFILPINIITSANIVFFFIMFNIAYKC